MQDPESVIPPPDDSGAAETWAPNPSASPASADGATAPLAEAAAAGRDRIGPYILLEVLGQGGFGVVWLAEQREPVRRRVAVKLIKPGMDSSEVVARFRAEQQALALMSHPCVAKVLDAGTTERGLPYFVMEYVPGEPITTYCDRHRLSVGERVELLAEVCDAVHHAHMRGVIHRDLKPSNILVTVPEKGAPRPVVIDFGVAKALHQRLTDSTLHTQQGFLVGTPEYMSPEQAEMFGTDVDTRTDIYSLGVVLYELLTGALPFEPASLRRAGYDEIRRIIREVEPPRPSTRLSSPTSAAAAAQARRTGVDELERALRRELEWIPLYAMRKDRTRRYRSAAEFADDLRNYQAGRALIAGPETAAYRMRKFVGRNARTVAATASLLAVIVLGVAGTLWQARRAGERARQAEAAEHRATAINDFVQGALRSADPIEGGDEDVTIVEAMERALEDIDSGAFRDEPETEAAILSTIADVLLNNGRFAEAETLFERVLAQQRALHPTGDHVELVQAMNALANARVALNDLADANDLLTQALAMHRRLPDGEPEDLALLLNNVASVREDLGLWQESEELYRESIRTHQEAASGDNEEFANTLANLSSVRARRGDFEEAERLCRQSLDMRRRLHGEKHPYVATSLNNLSVLVGDIGRDDEAEALQRQALAIYQQAFSGDHPSVADAMCNLAGTLLERENLREAESLASRSLAMRRRLFPKGHPDIANSLHTLALIESALGDEAAAEQHAREAVTMQVATAGSSPALLVLQANLASILLGRGNVEEARLIIESVAAAARGRSDLSDDDAKDIAELHSAIEAAPAITPETPRR